MRSAFDYIKAIGVSLALSAPLIPAISFAEESSAPPVTGFYANAFAGMIVMDSTIVFPATESRPQAKFVDQGGDGALFGARLGWGTLVSQHIYTGIEAEGLVPWNATSRLKAFGVEYRTRLRSEIGAYGRIGWSPDGRSLLFFRAGLTVPRQNFETVQDGARRGADWTAVPALGLGAEVPLTRHVAFRIDASYTWPNGDNIFETYRLNAGLTYRF